MVKILLVIGLIGILSVNAFSQNKNYYKPGNSWSKIEMDSSLMKRFNHELVIPPKSFSETDQHFHVSPDDFPGMPQRKAPDDHMPCIHPHGNFSAVIVKPDTTIWYHLLIQEP